MTLLCYCAAMHFGCKFEHIKRKYQNQLIFVLKNKI